MSAELKTLVYAALTDDICAGEPIKGGSLTVAASLVTRHPNLHGCDLHQVAGFVAEYREDLGAVGVTYPTLEAFDRAVLKARAG